MKAFTVFLFITSLLPIGLNVAAEPAAPDSVAELEAFTADEAEAGGNALTNIAGQFGVTWATLIAQMINFAIVAVILYYFAVKPVAATLDERQQKIADGLQYAEEMKTQLAEAERERAEKVKEAAVEAQTILTEAREQSKEMIEQKTQEAAAQAEAILRKASEATELERQKMIADVRQEVARLVVATSATVLARDLSDSEKQTFSDSAARELATADS
ncbi:MAG: F0F1 ATP synthase subunit B [Verrucomicrobia bacterium]|nr:F0F1 ATP synthase subunit B [Verrucomicrobiota bacterium]